MPSYTLVVSDFEFSDGQKELKLARLQQILDDGNDEIKFPSKRFSFAIDEILIANPDDSFYLTLSRDTKITFGKHIIRLKDGGFNINLAGFHLRCNAYNSFWHFGLFKTKVLETIDLKTSSRVKLASVQGFRENDLLRSSFVEAGVSKDHNQLLIKGIDSTNNEITELEYYESGADPYSGSSEPIDLSNVDHTLILPRNTFVGRSNGWSAIKIVGAGKFTLTGATFTEAQGKFLAFEHPSAHSGSGQSQDVTIHKCVFIGTFADALGVGGFNEIGKINLDITKSAFKDGYDTSKQCISFYSSGNLSINQCIFNRNNRDSDIVLTGSENKNVGTVNIKRCHFNGVVSKYEDVKYLAKTDPEFEALTDKRKNFLSDNCLHAIKINSATSMDINRCLFDKYEREAIKIFNNTSPQSSIGIINARACLVYDALILNIEVHNQDFDFESIKLIGIRNTVGNQNYFVTYIYPTPNVPQAVMLAAKIQLEKSVIISNTNATNQLRLHHPVHSVSNTFVGLFEGARMFNLLYTDANTSSQPVTYNFDKAVNLVGATLNAQNTDNTGIVKVRSSLKSNGRLINAQKWVVKNLRFPIMTSPSLYVKSMNLKRIILIFRLFHVRKRLTKAVNQLESIS